jgi:diketogulonate reductase-like aldo/keto reductase
VKFLFPSPPICFPFFFVNRFYSSAYRNEVDLGVAIKESKINRSELYITTKVMSKAADPEAALAASLKKLQLDHVDLYLIHAPYYADEGNDTATLQASWAAMERLQQAGHTTSIGVSNFLPAHLSAILATAKVPPAINQVEFHPYLPRASLLAFQREPANQGIAVAAYGPLSPVTKGSPGPLDATLQALARKYAVSESEILLRWAIEQDVAVVTTSSKEQRLSNYLRCTRFKLTPEEVREIARVGEEKHLRCFWAKKFADDDRS